MSVLQEEIALGEYELKTDLLLIMLFLLGVADGQLTLARLLDGCSVPVVAAILLNMYLVILKKKSGLIYTRLALQ